MHAATIGPRPGLRTAPAAGTAVRALLVLVAGGMMVLTVRLEAQTTIRERLAAAKQYILDLNTDSAGLVLPAILDPASGASAAERAWAFSLMALVRLEAADRAGAQTMFRQALRADARLPIDSIGVLRELQSEAEGVLLETRRVFAAEEGAAGQPAGPRAPLSVRFEVPAETSLAVDGRLPIVPVPSRRARSVVTMTLADAPGAILWRSDTLAAGGTGAALWPVRTGDGRVVAPGRYLFAVTALDEASEQARAEWIVVVERVAPDTQPIPGPVRADELRPETLQVRHRAPAGLVLGVGIGALALALPQVVGRPELNAGLSRDGTAIVAAGTATVAGLVGFAGGRRPRAVPENASYNAELLRQHASRVAEVEVANARARENAPVRVRLERAGP